MDTNKDIVTLELLIDKHGIVAILEMLSCICELKQGHITENWQDARLAEKWGSYANTIDNCIANF